MKFKGLTKKLLIKELEKIPNDPLIGLNVLTNQGSEFWQCGKAHLKLMDNGQTLALFQLRLKKALPSRVQMHQAIPSVDSINADIASALKQFVDRYDFDSQFSDIDDGQVQYMILHVIRKDIQELIRLNDDFVRLFNKKELTQEFSYS